MLSQLRTIDRLGFLKNYLYLLHFQNEKNEKCAAELFIVNQALISQNKDKQIQAEALQILNTELKAAEGNCRKLNEELKQKAIISPEELQADKKEG